MGFTTAALRINQPSGYCGDYKPPGHALFDVSPADDFDPARVPGHPEWHLAPREMAWQNKTLGEICEQIKDPRS
jgi:hypothetical protein